MATIDFGKVIKDRRVSRGWTQEQLASTAEISTRYVQSLEAGNKSPSIETVFKLSKALGTSPGLLLEPLWKDWKRRS